MSLKSTSLIMEVGDDDEFFGFLESQKPGNLKEVFGKDLKKENENVTLKYQPAKTSAAPKVSPQTPLQDNKTPWTTLLAKVTGAFKNSESMGKVGAAILTNGDEGKIILYKTKTNVLGTRSLNDSYQSVYKKSNYLQFYDDDHHYWSLLFDKTTDEEEFVLKLKDFRVNVIKENDLSKGEERNDNFEENYTHSEKPSNIKDNFSDSKTNKPTKNTLLARVAKVGQPLPLYETNASREPVNTSASAEYSDSSETEEIVTPLAQKPTLLPRPHKLHSPKTHYLSSSISNYATGCANPTTTIESQLMQMLLSENRTQNSETRINISKLESKIEKVLDKLDCMRFASPENQNKEDEMLQLEENILLLKKENRKLKLMLEENVTPLQFTENILKFYHTKLDSLGLSNITDVKELISQLLGLINDLQIKVKNSEEVNVKKCQELEQSVKLLNNQNAEVLARQTELQKSIDSLNYALNKTEEENIKLKLALEQSKKENLEELDKQKQQTLNTVKTIMNNLHRNLSEQLETNHSLEKEKVLALIGKTIREETLKSITEIN